MNPRRVSTTQEHASPFPLRSPQGPEAEFMPRNVSPAVREFIQMPNSEAAWEAALEVDSESGLAFGFGSAGFASRYGREFESDFGSDSGVGTGSTSKSSSGAACELGFGPGFESDFGRDSRSDTENSSGSDSKSGSEIGVGFNFESITGTVFEFGCGPGCGSGPEYGSGSDSRANSPSDAAPFVSCSTTASEGLACTALSGEPSVHPGSFFGAKGAGGDGRKGGTWMARGEGSGRAVFYLRDRGRHQGGYAGLISLLVLLLLSFSSEAIAESRNIDEARQLLRRAQRHYEEGSYELAAGLFIATWDLHPYSPTLLFNAAQAYRLCGRQEEARDWYERFLEEMPDSPNRQEAESRISQLNRSIQRRRTPSASSASQEKSAASVPSPNPSLRTSNTRTGNSLKGDRTLDNTAARGDSGSELGEERGQSPAREWISHSTDSAAAKSASPKVGETNSGKKSLSADTWDFEDPTPPKRRLDQQKLSQLQIILLSTAGLLATGAAISYGIAHAEWSDASASERPRVEAEQQIQSADTAHAVSLGLGGAALLVGAGFGLSFAF